MKLTPKHKYLILSRIDISGLTTVIHLEANDIYTGSEILSMMKGKYFINAQVFKSKPVYDLTSKHVYLFCVDAHTIPSVPELRDDEPTHQHLVPLQLLMDLDLSKLLKYLDHRYETIRNLARFLLEY